MCMLSGRALPSTNVWLDATDSETEGTFKWMATNEVMTYTNWRSGEPNNAHGGEDCVHFYINYNGEWNDANCEGNYNSICEIES